MRQERQASLSLLMIEADLLRQINFEDLLINCCFTPIQQFLYYGENKLIFNEVMMRFALF